MSDFDLMYGLSLVLTAIGYFCAGRWWERERSYSRNRILGGEPCCCEWDTCCRPCTPRGEKIAERRYSAAHGEGKKHG